MRIVGTESKCGGVKVMKADCVFLFTAAKTNASGFYLCYVAVTFRRLRRHDSQTKY